MKLTDPEQLLLALASQNPTGVLQIHHHEKFSYSWNGADKVLTLAADELARLQHLGYLIPLGQGMAPDLEPGAGTTVVEQYKITPAGHLRFKDLKVDLDTLHARVPA